MPTTQIPITIAAKSSTLGAGDYITFQNLTRGGKRTVKCSSKGEAAINNPPNTWVDGDVILIQVSGKYNKGAQATIHEGGIRYDLGTLSEDTTTVAVSL